MSSTATPIANDVTARDLQRTDDQWARAKGFDSFCPLGPWIETELDIADLQITTELNGEEKQRGEHQPDDVRRRDDHRLRHVVHDAAPR